MIFFKNNIDEIKIDLIPLIRHFLKQRLGFPNTGKSHTHYYFTFEDYEQGRAKKYNG